MYVAELFYLQEQQGFPFQKAVQVTAGVVARSCSHFQARLVTPLRGDIVPIERQGLLPTHPWEKEALVTELVNWIFTNSTVDELFYLLLDDAPIPQANKVAKFDHHDDTYCWFLNLSETEFAILQDAWRQNDLPTNLFYPEQETVCVPYSGNDLRSKILRLLGVRKCYTPMQLQNGEIAG
ncbi:MAG: hypothetical protein Q6K80_11695 [Thermostichus sp. DG_1_6_bins_120]